MAAAGTMTDSEIRTYLQGKGVPQFVDQFIKRAIQEQPTDFKALLRNMVKADQRATKKGAKSAAPADDDFDAVVKAMKSSAAGGQAEGMPPAYCMRDPKMRPTADQIKAKGVVTWDVTRSEILDPDLNKDYASTVAAQFNVAAHGCQLICQKIEAECKKQKKPFFDESFWFGMRNNMYPKGTPEDCTVTEPTKAMRASELYPKAPLFADGCGSNDIVQGGIGDCFYIGAVSALAGVKDSKLKPLERLFVFHNIEWGIFGVCFFKNGEWEWVIVDDFIAINQEGKNVWPQYAAPGTSPELWPVIIEKAYAKLHFCWDSIDGGFSRQALEDLTGGLAYTLNLYKDDKEKYGGADFKKFKALVDDPYTVLGCSVGWHIQDEGGAGRAGEQGAMHGLFKGHAYSVISFAESEGVGFVQVRNPWGNEAEWKGRYCDNSPDWDKNPKHKRNINPTFANDGTFWMLWDDFRTIFTDTDVVHFFPYDWCVLSFVGKASKNDETEKNTYMLEVTKPVKGLVFSLGQDDPLTSLEHAQRKNASYAVCTVCCYKLTRKPKDFQDMMGCLGEKMGPQPARTRSLFHTTDLEPGLYCIMPKFKDAQKLGFYVRVFCPPDAELQMWRCKDERKWTTQQARQDGASVPTCGVPREDGAPVRDQVVESRPIVAIKEGNTPEVALHSIGCTSQREYNALLSHAFNEADRFNQERLNAVQAREAMQQVLADCPVVEKGFQKKWDALSKGSALYEMRLNDFNEMMQEVLEEMHTFQVEVKRRKAAGTLATGGPISMLKRGSKY